MTEPFLSITIISALITISSILYSIHQINKTLEMHLKWIKNHSDLFMEIIPIILELIDEPEKADKVRLLAKGDPK